MYKTKTVPQGKLLLRGSSTMVAMLPIIVVLASCVCLILIIESPLLKWFFVGQLVWFLLSRTIDDAWIWLNSGGKVVRTVGCPAKQPSPDDIQKAQKQFDASLFLKRKGRCNISESPLECDRPANSTIPSANSMVSNSEISLPERVAVVPYVHGGYFGAAPFLLQDPAWLAILRKLMPKVFVEVGKIVASSPQSKWIQWGEDNPVVAAYGIYRTLTKAECLDGQQLPAIEWDVFLDPTIVRQCEFIMSQKEEMEIDLYHHSLQSWGSVLVESMLIAHGTVSQILCEQFGPGKVFNFERVKETPLSLGGGVSAREWMSIFTDALHLGFALERSAPWVDDAKPNGTNSRVPTLRESCDTIDSILGSQRSFEVVLDLKSRHVPLRVWGLVVDTLHQAGIGIRGVGSFCRPEIRGLSDISKHCQIQEITFFHSAGDLQKACHDGRIKKGDIVMFNAGSLVSRNNKGSLPCLGNVNDPPPKYGIFRFAGARPGFRKGSTAGPADTSTLMDYKVMYNLSIGLYCQEYAIDPAALMLLTGLVNEHPDLYNLGFAWGGINGVTLSEIQPGRFTTSTDGYSFGQRLIGKRWDYSLYPMISHGDYNV